MNIFLVLNILYKHGFKNCYNSILLIVYHNLILLFLLDVYIVYMLHFQSFGTINNAVMNILVHTFICMFDYFLRINSVSGLTGSKDGES